MGYRVFIQIPDASLQRSLGEQLAAKGHDVETSAATADILMLDGGADSAEDCSRLRRGGCLQPILLLGATLVAARAAGADHALTKPFRLADLLRALDQAAVRPPIAVGRFRLDANAREMIDDQGRSLRLTEKEAAILAYLARAGDQAVGREELLGEVWGYNDGASTHTVETHIYRLRRKLTENGGGELLVTEAGGYRLGPGEAKPPR